MIAVWVKAPIRRSTIAATILYLDAFYLSQLIFRFFFFLISFYVMIMENQIFVLDTLGQFGKFVKHAYMTSFLFLDKLKNNTLRNNCNFSLVFLE